MAWMAAASGRETRIGAAHNAADVPGLWHRPTRAIMQPLLLLQAYVFCVVPNFRGMPACHLFPRAYTGFGCGVSGSIMFGKGSFGAGWLAVAVAPPFRYITCGRDLSVIFVTSAAANTMLSQQQSGATGAWCTCPLAGVAQVASWRDKCRASYICCCRGRSGYCNSLRCS
jgi:hypothetical protein